MPAKLFAVDCRAWVTEAGMLEAHVGLVDFADGEGDLEIQWSIDGVLQAPTHEPRPRTNEGHALKYNLERTIALRLTPGEHKIAAQVQNAKRSATCSASLVVP